MLCFKEQARSLQERTLRRLLNTSQIWFKTGCYRFLIPYFAEKRQTPASDLNSFSAAGNAWCVVVDITDSTKDGTPFIYTKNLAGTSLAAVSNNMNLNASIVPFGDNGLVVCQKGGSSFALRDSQVTYANFNPAGSTNSVLQPQ